MNISAIHKLVGAATYAFYYDKNGDISRVEWSDEFRHLLGYEDENDFPNTFEPWLNSFHPDDFKPELEKIAHTAISFAGNTLSDNYTPHTFSVDGRLRKKNGTYIWLRITSGYIPCDEPDCPTCFCGFIFDITKEKGDTDDSFLAEHWAPVYGVVDMANIGVWEWHSYKDRPYELFGNPSYRQLIADTRAEVAPQELYKLWKEGYDDKQIPRIKRFVEKMKAGEHVEFIYPWNHPTLGQRYLRTYGAQFFNSDGEWVARGYVLDVTDTVAKVEAEKKYIEAARKRAEAQSTEILELNHKLEDALKRTEAADRAKTSFLFNMSHDIRTPMNAIIGYAELMRQHFDDHDKCRDYLSKITSSSQFLLSLINNVLEMARIESGQVKLDEEPKMLGEVINNISNVYSDLMAKKNITFITESNITTKAVYFDNLKVKEIFLNLVSNALKYTPEGGTVSMIFDELPSEREGYVKFQATISDTGIGMSKEFIPTVFDEFSRERNTTENKIQGTGLGLPIVKKLIELMGGTIEVHSELGKGTTFITTLEHRIADEKAMQSDQKVDVSDLDFSGKRILLAEDNELNAEIAIEILKMAGLEVDLAPDGVICVDKMVKAPAGTYDAILMDIQMPNLDGYLATQKIRRLHNPKKADIPIIAMTANAFEEDKINALAAGMNGHLAKPIEIPKLMDVLAEILKR